MTALKEPPMPPARAVARPRSVVYHHPRWKKDIMSLHDPAINFEELTGRAAPDGDLLESRLRDYMLAYWSAGWVDHPAIQTGDGSRVGGYNVRETFRHKGEHGDSPGVAAETETAPAIIIHVDRAIDWLKTNGDLNDRHLWLLKQVWREKRPKFRRGQPAGMQREQTCAGLLQVGDGELDRLWREATVRLYFSLWV